MRTIKLYTGIIVTGYWLLVIGSQFSIFNFQFSIEHPFSFFLSPFSISKAHAQCPASPASRELAGKTPIGHYAQAVVDRVNVGIQGGKTAPVDAGLLDSFHLHFLTTIQSIFYMLVDTDLRSVEYQRNLTSITPCFHIDLAILEAKIEEVRCEINEAYKRKSPRGIRILKSTAQFLNQRYKHLVKGGLEPEHKDNSWQYHYNFDPPVQGSCCVLTTLECQQMTSANCVQETTESGLGDFYPTHDDCLTGSICVATDGSDIPPAREALCPFDSNYFESGPSGYGCTANIYEDFASGISQRGIQAEARAERELHTVHEEFVTDIEHIKDALLNMDDLADNTILSEREREHLDTAFGTTVIGAREHKRAFGCNADLPKEGLTAVPLRSSFFFHKNQLDIWKAFFRLQHRWAQEREFPPYLKNPDEFVRESDRRKAMERDSAVFGLIVVPRNSSRSELQDFMLRQATQEAAILPKAQDMGQEVAKTLEPVRSSMMKNVRLITEPEDEDTFLATESGEGLRNFVKNHAYFLRRSCIYRPCNNRLDQIMKIVLSDECFPYTSGAFENGIERNPEYEQCMEETGDTEFCGDLHEPYIGQPHWEKCKDAVESLR